MNPLVKKLTTAVLCVTALTSPLFLTGCSFSKVANGVQQGSQKASQEDVKVFNNYIKAVILTVIQCALAMLSVQTFKT